MALSALLQIGDNSAGRYTMEYLVSDFKCRTTRRHNEVRPDSDARCERLELTVVAPGRDDLNLYEWYVSCNSFSGRILIELSGSSANGQDEWKEVLFEEAVCFAISEDYFVGSHKRRELKLCFVADQVTIDDHKFKN